mgnify:FL=1
MKTVEIKVKNCRNCPFSVAKFQEGKIIYVNCYAPTQIHKGYYKIDSYYKNYKLPKFCPLKLQSLKISL